MFILFDKFNLTEISRHRKLERAVDAMEKHTKKVKEKNGPNSYIPYEIVRVEKGIQGLVEAVKEHY
jgi:hypothetical protein